MPGVGYTSSALWAWCAPMLAAYIIQLLSCMEKNVYTALCDFIPFLYAGALCGCFMPWLIPLYAICFLKMLYARLCTWWTDTHTQKKRKKESWESVWSGIKRYKERRRQEESEQDREERRQKEGSIKSKIKWYRDEWQRTLWKIKERGTKRGQQRGVERKRGESGSSCMPENAWQESRDTGEIQACDIWVSGLRFMPAYVLALYCFMLLLF